MLMDIFERVFHYLIHPDESGVVSTILKQCKVVRKKLFKDTLKTESIIKPFYEGK